MRYLLFGMLLLVAVLAGCAPTAALVKQDAFYEQIVMNYPELNQAPYITGKVERVIDGDTFVLEGGERVRIIGVNTPEISGAGEPFGKEASEFARGLLQGKPVYLFRDAGDTDRYGRLLRYVFIEGSSRMFNEQLLTEGYGSTMTIPPNVMFAEAFVQLEREAREQSKGLWSNETTSSNSEVQLACENPTIKGNINSRGDRIYHLPSSRYYSQTIAEVMFCTEEEALQAGFRAPKTS